MSVDDRIREGLIMTEQHLRTPDTATAFEDVTRAGDRRTTRRRIVVAGAAAAAAAVVAIAVTLATDDPKSSPTPSNPPTSAPTAQAEAPASPIEGTWRSDPVTFEAMAANLRDNGLQASVPALRAELGDFGRTRVTVTLVDGDETVLLGGEVVSTSAYTLGAGTVTLDQRNRLDRDHRPSGPDGRRHAAQLHPDHGPRGCDGRAAERGAGPGAVHHRDVHQGGSVALRSRRRPRPRSPRSSRGTARCAGRRRRAGSGRRTARASRASDDSARIRSRVARSSQVTARWFTPARSRSCGSSTWSGERSRKR